MPGRSGPPPGSMEGHPDLNSLCDVHLRELAAYSSVFLQPPQCALERRGEGEQVLRRILRIIEDCPRCRQRLAGDIPSRFDVAAAPADPWSDVRVRVTCVHEPGGAWTCTYHADVKRKVLLLGDRSARKVELVRGVAYDPLPDGYRDIVGAKILTRHETVTGSDDGVDVHVVFTVWDVVGRRFTSKRPLRAFFRGAKAVLAVCDLAEIRSVEELGYWLSLSERILGGVAPVILVRERSSPDPLPIAEARLAEFAQTFGATVIAIPGDGGHRVEHLFQALGEATARDVWGAKWRSRMFA